ncbi:hypothetical protein NN561_004009 [Cricetulus griseus]
MAIGRRQDRGTCGQTDDLTSRKVSLTPLWYGSPEAPRISRGTTHSTAHRRWWRRARDLTPPPARLSPAPSPGGASAQKTVASPPPGPRTLDLVRLARRGPAPSAPTAEAWRPGLPEGTAAQSPRRDPTLLGGRLCCLPPRGCSGLGDPPPKGGSGGRR